ncbi:MAG: hypothetical protein MI976_22950 [Pseudomonadales bacterium]|nr:hypothetical protein [Pseudomonadales bacterium]
MKIRKLNEQETKEVAGGVLKTQFVAISPSLGKLSAKIDLGGAAADVCQCVNCCSNHYEMEELVIKPLR